MSRIIFLYVFLISAFMVQNSRCDDGQQCDQGNQQNQNGNGGDKDSKYYCEGFEILCPFKKIRYVLHKVKTAMTPSNGFHMPEFKLRNPFNPDNYKKNNDDGKQNGDSQNQQGSPNFNPPAFNPPDFQLHNPFQGEQGR